MLKLTVRDVEVDTFFDCPVIKLSVEGTEETFRIWVGKDNGTSVVRALVGEKMKRPDQHTLFSNTIKSLGAKIEKVVLTKFVGNIFYSEIILLTKDGNTITIDSRPSDSIAIALISDAPIFATINMLESVSNGGYDIKNFDAVKTLGMKMGKEIDNNISPEDFII